jgi:hypothetical protein
MLVHFKFTSAFHRTLSSSKKLHLSGLPTFVAVTFFRSASLEHEGISVSGGRQRGSLHRNLQATEWGAGGALCKISSDRSSRDGRPLFHLCREDPVVHKIHSLGSHVTWFLVLFTPGMAGPTNNSIQSIPTLRKCNVNTREALRRLRRL